MSLWLLAWGFFGLPWDTFSRRPRLRRISIIPFRRARRRDQFLNFVFYIPFGALGIVLGWPAAIVTAAGGVLSGVTEFLQIFSRNRIPSSTDLLLNTAGTLVGVAIVMYVRHRSRTL